jgi:hypothetical protein
MTDLEMVIEAPQADVAVGELLPELVEKVAQRRAHARD